MVDRKFRPVWYEGLLMLAPVFKRGWLWILFSEGVGTLTSFVAAVLEKYSEKYVIPGVAAVVVIQLALSLFGLVIVNQIIEDVRSGVKHSLNQSLRDNLKFMFVNFARATLKTVLGVILFIVPGILYWIKYSFVPYVVLFDPEFQTGQIDALERSQSLVRGRFWRVAGILILCALLSIVPEFWLGTISPLERPYPFVLVFFLGMWLELYGDTVTYCLYRKITG